MPLLKKRPFALVAPSEVLPPDEEVWQIRFTKEMFTSYAEYLERMNLYRRRVWSCRITGKGNLTYEEALVSEQQASMKLVKFPQIFMGHVLDMVQFSTLRIDGLVTMIVEKLGGTFVEGEELLGGSENPSRPCKIMKDLSCCKGASYEVGWLSKNGEVISTSIEDKNKLTRKKFPFTRGMLKLFIKESTFQMSPWLIHDKLAKKHGIPTKPLEYPIEDLSVKLAKFPQIYTGHVLNMVQFSTLKLNGLVTMIVEKLGDTFVEGEKLLGGLENPSRPCKIMKVLSCRKGASYEVGWLSKTGEVISTSIEDKDKLTRKKFPFSRGMLKLFIKESTFQRSPWLIHDKLAEEHGIPTKPLKYPIEDLSVKPSADDPSFFDRPSPSSKFLIPSGDVGDLLMVWDFFSRFGKVLHLSPFSLGEFEKAIVYEGISSLLIEAHIAVLTLLVEDRGEYCSLIKKKKRTEVITSKVWVEYLCDFLELENHTEYRDHISKLNAGKYSVLGVNVKLQIFGDLLHRAIMTEVIRGELDRVIEQQQALVASKRQDDIEELRKRREEKRSKEMEVSDQREKDDSKGIGGSTPDEHQQADLLDDSSKEKEPLSTDIKRADERGSKLEVLASRQAIMKRNSEAKIAAEREQEIARMEELKRVREENRSRAKEAMERKLKEQRLEQFEREMEKLHIRTESLGYDRGHNTYWFLRQQGQLFVESTGHDLWGFYSSKDELDALMNSLNPKGVRELFLQRSLEKYYPKICSAFHEHSKELVQSVGSQDTAILRRSVRVSAVSKDESKAPSFLTYVNRWRA